MADLLRLIKRTTIVARLFYHTAMCLLAQIHPRLSVQSPEMHDMQIAHSHQICGIAAHVKDRYVSHVLSLYNHSYQAGVLLVWLSDLLLLQLSALSRDENKKKSFRFLPK